MFRSLEKLLDLAPLGMCNQMCVLHFPVIPPTLVLYPASPAQITQLATSNYLKE